MFCSPKGTAAVVPSGEKNILSVTISNSFAYNVLAAQEGLYQVLNTSFTCIWRLQCSHAIREMVIVLHTDVFSVIRINPLFILAVFATLKRIILKGKEICKREDEQLHLLSCLFWANKACYALLPSVHRPLTHFGWKYGHGRAKGTGHGSSRHVSSQFFRRAGQTTSDCSKGQMQQAITEQKEISSPLVQLSHWPALQPPANCIPFFFFCLYSGSFWSHWS